MPAPASCGVGMARAQQRPRTWASRAWIFSGVSPLPFLAIFSSSGMACSSSVALVLRSSAFSAALSARFFSAAISSDRCKAGGSRSG